MTLTHFGLGFTRLRPFLFDSLFPCAPPLYRRQHLSSSYRVAANCPQSECAPLVLLRPAWTIKRTCGICMCDANTIPQIFDDRHDGCDNGRVLSHGATPQSGPLHHGGATRPSHALRDQRPPRTSPARLAASPAGLASTGPLPPPRLSCFADSFLRVFFTVCHCDLYQVCEGGSLLLLWFFRPLTPPSLWLCLFTTRLHRQTQKALVRSHQSTSRW